MASGHRSLESRRPSSPGNACGDSSVGNFSLLGQQFTHYNGAQHHQSWSPSPSSTLGFVLEAHLQQGTHSQQQPPSSHAVSQPQPPRSHSQSRPGENVVSAVSGYDGPAPAFPFPVGQDYNTVFGRQRLQESNVRGLEKMSTPDSSMFSAISPQALMSALSILQQKIQELQAMVQLIVQGGGQSPTALAQLQAMTTGVASVISQLVLATSGILQQSAVPATAIAADLQLSQLLGGAVGFGLHHLQQNGICNVLSPAQGNGHGNPFASVGTSRGGAANMSGDVGKSASLGGVHGGSGLGASGVGAPSLGGEGLDSLSRNFRSCLTFGTGNFLGNSFDVAGGANGGLNSGAGVGNKHEENAVGTHLIAHASGALQGPMEELDFGTGLRDEEDDGEGDNLPPGSYELVEMEAVEILAEHTHFCGICGKGFKRDANLRMHMRGHGDEYKTPAALARPDKPAQDTSTVRPRRYSCPFGGCKRNKKHRKFQPLKSILCVKNHYRRSHCPKILICRKCKTKKFSVVADLKTHEKHCGSDKWQCSCGTTFSRKDKLLGHIGLFVGHTPLHDLEGAGGGLTAGINGNDVFNAGNCSGIGTESVFQAPPGNNHFGYGNG